VLTRSIDKPAKKWESTKEIIFDNCPVKKTKQAHTVIEEVVTDENTIANEFNLYFTTAAASIRPQQRTVDEEDNQFYQTTTPGPITQGEVSNIIKGLNNKSAIGPDDVPAKLLKKYEEKLSPILANHINASLTRGQFPDTIKRAKDSPIFKAVDRANVCNYRLISVLSNLSKIIETHISRRLNCFLRDNQILHQNQYGFVPKSNTLSACAGLIF
jgi:hypothetical protein